MDRCVHYKKIFAALLKIIGVYIGILLFPIVIKICYGIGIILGSQVRFLLN